MELIAPLKATGLLPWAWALTPMLLATTVACSAHRSRADISLPPGGLDGGSQGDDGGPGFTRTVLHNGWMLQSSARVASPGAGVSLPAFSTQGWFPITVPATVIAGQLQNHLFPDPFYGKNLDLIDPTPYEVPWWYRAEFVLPLLDAGTRVQLKLEGICYRADVWLNGVLVANAQAAVGPFRAFEWDITDKVKPGVNVLALEIAQPSNPGSQYGGDLAITFVDWNPQPPDWNMGILNDVVVSTSGAVKVKHPLVTTHLDSPSLDWAHLTVAAQVENASSQAVAATLWGGFGEVSFSQDVVLQPHENKTVVFSPVDFPQLDIPHPTLWWPWQYGEPFLHALTLMVKTGGTLSDSVSTKFGIREITSSLNSFGSRVFSVNGKPIMIRGGAWAPEMFQRRDPTIQAAQVRYLRDLNLNAVRFEGKFEDEHLFDLLDQYGLLVMAGWNCCDSWQAPQNWSPAQLAVGLDSLRNLMLRLRNHASMMVWLNGSDQPASMYDAANVEQMYIDLEHQLLWPNPVLSHAAQFDTDFDMSVYGHTGLKMLGPYDWVPPNYWETDAQRRLGGAWGFATEISPGPAVPPLDSLVQFIPPEHLWPMDDVWNHHAGRGAFGNLDVFTAALSARYGEAHSAAEYTRKAQVMAYESHRAMFEAYGRHKYDASGVIQWMAQNAWPSMIWHLYDFSLRPGGSYFGVKNALEPLHIQYSYVDRAVVVVNSTLNRYPNLHVSASLHHLDGTLRYTNGMTLPLLDADSSVVAFTLPELSPLTNGFLRLTLADANNITQSLQTYWLSWQEDVPDWDHSMTYDTPTAGYADFTWLASLPPAHLNFTDTVVAQGSWNLHRVHLDNGASVAFFVRLKITAGLHGEEVLPVLWQDNDVTLLPNETRDLTATYELGQLHGAAPVLEVAPYNP